MLILMNALKRLRAFITPPLSISIGTEKRFMRCLVQGKKGSCGAGKERLHDQSVVAAFLKCTLNYIKKFVASLIDIIMYQNPVILKALYHPQS